ncbi:MAG: transglutaminase domain-containing protein [Anaerolineae bacterium]|nr:transglutaminase domain-containing protein [Anaerolineae bacterium]
MDQSFFERLHISEWVQRHGAGVLLVVVMLGCLPGSLMAGGWLRSNQVLWGAALGSLSIGLLLARSIRHPAVLAGIAMIVGILWIAQTQSRALPPARPGVSELVAMGQWAGSEIGRVVHQTLTRPEDPLPASSPPDLPEWRAAAERLSLYIWNLQTDWPPRLAPSWSGGGQILLGSLLGLLVWMVTVLSLWVLIRQHSIWWALMPTVGILALNIFYTAKGWEHLVICLSAGLLLASSNTQERLENRWGEQALPYWLSTDRLVSTSTVILIVGLAMALTIKLTDPEFHRQVRDMLESSREKTAGQSGITRSVAPSPGVWPREHLLGSGPELIDTPVMSVRTPGISAGHFYWQATSYSQYTGHGWLSSRNKQPDPDAAPLWPESPEPPPGFVLLRQSFWFESSTQAIYAAGRPVRLIQAAEGLWSDPFRIDLISVNALIPQSAYEVLSWVPSATPDDLRSASESYPDWVEETYLALPDEIPGRVVSLSEEIVDDAPTAYDKALALQKYLRDNYPYTLELDAPPVERDVVDYFLFDLEKGYCDYYASAMTVMARSVGLPARLAVGYATGTYDPVNLSYQVTMAESHSWTQIYFTDLGWINFEPTASREAIEHGAVGRWVEEAEIIEQEDVEAFEEVVTPRQVDLIGKLWLFIAVPSIIVAAVGSIALRTLIRTHQRRRYTSEDAITSLYRDLLTASRRLGLAHSVTQTPHEFLAALRSELAIRAQHGSTRWGDWEIWSEKANYLASDLVSLYVDLYYSPRLPDQISVQAAIGDWPRLNGFLWLFRLSGQHQAKEDQT